MATALLLLGSVYVAKGQFKLSAEIRPRAEFRNGFKRPIEKGLDPAFFVEQRTRLTAGYVSDKFDFSMTMQDVRIWGGTSQVYKSDPALFNMYEAYGTYHFSTNHHLSLGRMALDYDNARILGNLDWAQQGRSHDLVKYTYKGASLQVDLGLAFNQDANTPEFKKLAGSYYSGVKNYKTMQYVWLHKDFEKAGLSVLALNNGVQYAPDTVHFSQTLGAYFTPQLGSTSFVLEAYVQGGKDVAGQDLRSYMLAASWDFINHKPVSLGVGTDILSGDDVKTAQNETFTPLYGTNHKFYGFMDYFYVGNGHSKKGLIDIYLKSKIKTGQQSSLSVHAHQFFAQTTIPATNDQAGDISSNLGAELDLVWVARLGPEIKFVGGYSQMFQTSSMHAIKDSVDPRGLQNWAWAMFVFKPQLLKNDKK